jgi:hypothetical protein
MVATLYILVKRSPRGRHVSDATVSTVSRIVAIPDR